MKRLFFPLVTSAFLLSACNAHTDHREGKASHDPVLNDEQLASVQSRVDNIEAFNKEALLLTLACSAYDYHLTLGDTLDQKLKTLEIMEAGFSEQVEGIRIVASSADAKIKCITPASFEAICQATIVADGQIVASDGKVETFSILKKARDDSAFTCRGPRFAIEGATDMIVDDLIDIIRSF